METPPNKQPEKQDIFMSLPGSEALSDEAQIAVYELDTFLHTVYDPFNDYVDWRGWMLGVCGRVLDLSNNFSNYALAIRHLLAQSARNIALYDTRQAAPKGYLIAKLVKTHPLLNSAEVPKNGIAYVEGWDRVYLKRRARLIAFIQFYEFLTQPDSCSTPIETTAVKLPYQWLDYINSFDLGFRKEMWGAASLWESHTHNSPATVQQAPTPPPPPPDAEAYPWAEIDALAGRIGLRKLGQFVPAGNRIAAAMAGMIDALCEAEILPSSGELERLYAAFTRHYGRSIKADRVTITRAAWQKKARTGLGLE